MSPEAFVHYRVGIENIDNEHWEILQLYESIRVSCQDNNHSKVFDKVGQLRRLLEAHYASEEEMMEKINFPYLKYHKSAHLDILSELNSLQPFCVKRNMFMVEYCTEVLNKMTIVHLDTLDRQYMEYYIRWKETATVAQ